jgi:hypothetical protein
MNFLSHAIGVTVLATLTACSTVMTTSRSGYLSDYDALTAVPGSASSRRAATQSIDPAQTSISEVVWRVDARNDIGQDERDILLTLLRREMQQRLQALPASPEGRPILIRAAITRVETVSPALNTVGTLLLIGPFDRGGAAVEIEAVDPLTGNQVAALWSGYFAPLSEFKARFIRLAPARIAVRKAVADFVGLLSPRSREAQVSLR